MKKFLAIMVISTALFLVTACHQQTVDQSINHSEGQATSKSVSEDQSIEQAPAESPEEPSVETITLEAENEYMIIDAIDVSDCKWEDGLFSGMMTFTSHTTQKYIDEYSDYFYRQIYFGFYNENGDLVGDEMAQNNCVYDREYTWEGSTYVLVSSKYPISEVKVLKIVCETPNEDS